jgi:hypothetical protein
VVETGLPAAVSPERRLGSLATDPMLIAAGSILLTATLVLFAGPGLAVVAPAAALLAGWSSAWSP